MSESTTAPCLCCTEAAAEGTVSAASAEQASRNHYLTVRTPLGHIAFVASQYVAEGRLHLKTHCPHANVSETWNVKLHESVFVWRRTSTRT